MRNWIAPHFKRNLSIIPDRLKYNLLKRHAGMNRRPLTTTLMLMILIINAHPSIAQTPITLEQAIREALLFSPRAKTALWARNAALADTDQENPRAQPSINITAAGTEQGSIVHLPDLPDAPILPEQYGKIELAIVQPVYRAGLEAARTRYSADKDAAQADYLKALSDLELTVAKAFLNVEKAEEGVKIAQEAVIESQSYQTLVNKQIESGTARPVDAETARAQAAEAQYALTKAESSVILARFNLNRLMGKPLEDVLVISPSSSRNDPPLTPDTAIRNALKSRPELRSLQDHLKAAEAGESLARLETQPSLSFRGELAEQSRTALLPSHYAAAGLELTWRLMDGGKRRQEIRSAKAQIERVKAMIQDAQQGIKLEALTDWQLLLDTREMNNLAKIRLEAAKATWRVARKAYEVGQGTALEEQAAARELRDADSSLLQAKYALQEAYLEYRYAQGDMIPNLQS